MKAKSLNYSLVFSAIFLVGLAAIFSYGFMEYKAEINNNDTLSGDVLNPQNILNITGNTDFSLNITLEQLSILEASNDLTNYIEDNKNITISLNVNPEEYKSAVTCDYVFYYEPTVTYTASQASKDNKLTELAFVGGAEDDLSFNTTSIDNISERKQLYSGNITTDPESGTAEQNWNLSYRFYNLDVDQADVIGQNPSGKIVIEGENCYATKN